MARGKIYEIVQIGDIWEWPSGPGTCAYLVLGVASNYNNDVKYRCCNLTTHEYVTMTFGAPESSYKCLYKAASPCVDIKTVIVFPP